MLKTRHYLIEPNGTGFLTSLPCLLAYEHSVVAEPSWKQQVVEISVSRPIVENAFPEQFFHTLITASDCLIRREFTVVILQTAALSTA